MQMARPKMRTLLVFLLLLAGGSIINIAVAWGIMIAHGSWKEIRASASLLSGGNRALTNDEIRWYRANEDEVSKANIPRQWPGLVLHPPPNARDQSGVGWCLISFTVLATSEGRSMISSVVTATRIECGWPCRSMIVEEWVSGKRTGWEFPISIDRENYVFPLQVVPAHFLINTLFYSTVIWLLLAAPFQFRRWRRIKRSVCPKCAYPIGSSDTCTECGRPVRRKTETQKAESA